MDLGPSLTEWVREQPLSILQLDPADRAVLRIADERDAIQKKTFTKWVNKHLIKASKRVDDLFVDLQDGHSLLSLLEVLSGETLPREKGRMRFHMLQNVQTALNFLRYRKIKLVNIRAEDIVDGNPKLTLGLIWTIILHFQISDITFTQNNESLTAKEALLRWAQRTTDRYPGVKVRDFTSSWRDGLAFNAIIHRNRPDLLEFRSCRTRTVRENLEIAFTIAERDLGVTRLLDPEDVDTPQPDEKSLITYISSLYDVFPEPASHNPFADDEKQRKADEYRELSSSLHLWLRKTISMLQNRNFPNTLPEVKALQSENGRFRVEEMPPRLQEKQRLSHLWRDMQKLMKENRIHIDEELRYDSLDISWNRMLSAHADRDRALQDEIARLEKLQRLAERVHREAKNCDARMDDVEKRIVEEEQRLGRLHPADAKHVCDQVDRDLRHLEDSIKSMFKDVQVLFDGRYHRAADLHKLVQKLHQRWSELRLAYQQRLLTPLSSKQYKVEERRVTKQRQVISESRLVETNEYFKFLQNCLDWVNEKLKHLEDGDYGSDLPSVQSMVDKHQAEHRLIDQFQKNVDMCISRKNQFKGEEQEQYLKLLSQLERGYSELLVLSNKRLSDLEALLEFIQAATAEIMWMNEREEKEVNRDWSAKSLNLVEVEQYHEALTTEMEIREGQFNSVLDHGSGLIRQQHPANKCIEAYLTAMQTQWAWLLELIKGMEVHLKHASHYHQFFKEAHECEQWLQRVEEKLNTTFSRHSFSMDEGERLLRQMQELREDLARYAAIVNSLLDRSHEVLPLKQRRAPLPRPLRVTAVCTYNQLNMAVTRNEQCWLHDNTQKNRWKVINAKGTEGLVPGVCFVIPPPNPEAIELAESLKRKYDLVVKLWTKKQHKLRLNMIFATIKIVKSWDLKTFRAMEPSQRESIIRALNEDADKLLAEGDPTDPDMRRLREEIRLCNKLFEELMAKLREEEAEKSPESPTRRFQDLSAKLEKVLQEKEKTLNTRVQAPIPRDLDTLDSLVLQHKEFEEGLQDLEPQVAEMRVAFKQMPKKTPTAQDRHDSVVRVWDRIWNLSHLYVERLKAVEIATHGLNDGSAFVSGVEVQLASLDELPGDQEALRKVHEDLLALQLEMQQQQPALDRLTEDVTNVKKVTERSRPNVYSHPDIRKLEDDLRKLLKRWSNASNQLVERLRSCEAASELLRAYRNKMDDERVWANQMTVKVNSVKVSKPSKDAEKEYQQALGLYTEISGKKPAIEEVNVLGGRFVREAKIYDLRLKRYSDGLEEEHPSLDASVAKKRPKVGPGGADAVSAEMDALNADYLALARDLAGVLEGLGESLAKETRAKFTVTLTRAAPVTLKTFHIELPTDLDEGTAPPKRPHRRADPEHPGEPHLRPTEAARGSDASPSPKRSKVTSPTTPAGPSVEKTISSTTTFTEVRSSRKTEKPAEETAPAQSGIRDPRTGQVVTFLEAIRRGYFIVERWVFVDITTGKVYEVPEAVSRGLVDQRFVDELAEPCGILDPKTGKELTLREAVRKGLYDPQRGVFLSPKGGRPVTIEEAIRLKLLKRERVEYLIRLGLIKVTRLTLAEAAERGLLNLVTGFVNDPTTGAPVPIDEAFEKGWLDSEPPADKEEGMSLTYAVDAGMVDEKTGKLTDNYSGGTYGIDEALLKGILSPDTREVADTKRGIVVTLPAAIKDGLLDAKKGQYVDAKTREKLPLAEARKRKVLAPSLTLKDAEEQGLLDEDGQVLNPFTNVRLSLLEAIDCGLLDPNVKCIIHPVTQETLSLSEALAKGVITPEGRFVNMRTREVLTLIQAVHLGLITSVCQKMIFDIEGFTDPATGDNISFNTAISRGILNPKTGQFTDTKSGKTVPFNKLVQEKVLQPQIYDMFIRKIGMKDDTGKELTLADAVFKGLIDPKTGQIRDKTTKLPMQLREAVAKRIITPEGAALLRGLLRITVSTATVTKTITRYVTVSSHGTGPDAEITSQDATGQTTRSGTRDPTLEEAVRTGLIGVDTDWPTDMGEFAPRKPVEPETIRRTEVNLLYDRELEEQRRSYGRQPTWPTGTEPVGPDATLESLVSTEIWTEVPPEFDTDRAPQRPSEESPRRSPEGTTGKKPGEPSYTIRTYEEAYPRVNGSSPLGQPTVRQDTKKTVEVTTRTWGIGAPELDDGTPPPQGARPKTPSGDTRSGVPRKQPKDGRSPSPPKDAQPKEKGFPKGSPERETSPVKPSSKGRMPGETEPVIGDLVHTQRVTSYYTVTTDVMHQGKEPSPTKHASEAAPPLPKKSHPADQTRPGTVPRDAGQPSEEPIPYYTVRSEGVERDMPWSGKQAPKDRSPSSPTRGAPKEAWPSPLKDVPGGPFTTETVSYHTVTKHMTREGTMPEDTGEAQTTKGAQKGKEPSPTSRLPQEREPFRPASHPRESPKGTSPSSNKLPPGEHMPPPLKEGFTTEYVTYRTITTDVTEREVASELPEKAPRDQGPPLSAMGQPREQRPSPTKDFPKEKQPSTAEYVTYHTYSTETTGKETVPEHGKESPRGQAPTSPTRVAPKDRSGSLTKDVSKGIPKDKSPVSPTRGSPKERTPSPPKGVPAEKEPFMAETVSYHTVTKHVTREEQTPKGMKEVPAEQTPTSPTRSKKGRTPSPTKEPSKEAPGDRAPLFATKGAPMERIPSPTKGVPDEREPLTGTFMSYHTVSTKTFDTPEGTPEERFSTSPTRTVPEHRTQSPTKEFPRKKEPTAPDQVQKDRTPEPFKKAPGEEEVLTTRMVSYRTVTTRLTEEEITEEEPLQQAPSDQTPSWLPKGQVPLPSSDDQTLTREHFKESPKDRKPFPTESSSYHTVYTSDVTHKGLHTKVPQDGAEGYPSPVQKKQASSPTRDVLRGREPHETVSYHTITARVEEVSPPESARRVPGSGREGSPTKDLPIGKDLPTKDAKGKQPSKGREPSPTKELLDGKEPATLKDFRDKEPKKGREPLPTKNIPLGKESTPTRGGLEGYPKGREPSPVKDLPQEKEWSPTKGDKDKAAEKERESHPSKVLPSGKEPTSTKGEVFPRGRDSSPIKDLPLTKDVKGKEPKKEREPSPTKDIPLEKEPTPTKDIKDKDSKKGREPSPAKELTYGKEPGLMKDVKDKEPKKGREPSPTKDLPLGKDQTPTKDVKDKDSKKREPSPTKELSFGKEPTLTKDPKDKEPKKGKEPSPTRDLPLGKEPTQTRDVKDKVSKKEREPSPAKELSLGKEPTPTKDDQDKDSKKGREPSPTKQLPLEKEPTPTNKKGREPSPTKQLPLGKEPSLTKDVKDKEPRKGREPSPTKDLPLGKQPTPTKDDKDKDSKKGREPSPTKELPLAKEPSLTKAVKDREPKKEREPSPTKELSFGKESTPTKDVKDKEPKKGREPSPTKDLPLGKEPALIKDVQDKPLKKEREPSPTKDLPLAKGPTRTKDVIDKEPKKGREPSPTKELSQRKGPTLSKEDLKDMEPKKGREPSPTKDLPRERKPAPTKDREPSPVKDLPKDKAPTKLKDFTDEEPFPKDDSKAREPSPTKDTRPSGDTVLPKHRETSPTKERPKGKAPAPPKRVSSVPESTDLPKVLEPLPSESQEPLTKEPTPGTEEPISYFTVKVTRKRGTSPPLEEYRAPSGELPYSRLPSKESSTDREPHSLEGLPKSPTKDKERSPEMGARKDRQPLPEKSPERKPVLDRQGIPKDREPVPGKEKPSPTREHPSGKELSPSKDAPKDRVPSPPEQEKLPSVKGLPLERGKSPVKEAAPSHTKDRPRDLPGRTSPSKEIGKAREHSPTKAFPEEKVPSARDQPGGRASPTKEHPSRGDQSPARDVPKEKSASRLPKDESDREPSPTRDGTRRTPSPSKGLPTDRPPSDIEKLPKETTGGIQRDKEPVRESPVKREPSPSKEVPQRISSPTKEHEIKKPSDEKTSKAGSPSGTRPNVRTPSPSKETTKQKVPPSAKDKAPSPTKEFDKGHRPDTDQRSPERGSPPRFEETKVSTIVYIPQMTDSQGRAPSPEKGSPKKGREEPDGKPKSPTRPKARAPSPPRRVSPDTETVTETGRTITTRVIERGGTTITKFTRETQVLEIPPDGWYLKEAIEQKLFDAKEGLFLIPGTDRLVSLEETLKMQIVNPDSATVREPGSKRTLSLIRALEKNILDSTGHYHDTKNKETLTMEEAIRRKVIILLERVDYWTPEQARPRSIHVTKVSGQPDVIEVKEGPEAMLEEIPKQDFPKFSEIASEVTFDNESLTVVDKGSGTTMDLVSALQTGLVDDNEFVVRDEETKKEMRYSEAVEKGIIDKGTGTYKDKKTGRTFKLGEAVKLGLLAIAASPMIVGFKAAEAVRGLRSARDEVTHATAVGTEPIRATKETTKIIRTATLHIRDAETGREVPLEEAVSLGLIDAETAKQLEDQSKTTEQTVHTTTTVMVTDPVTGENITLDEALQKGLLDKEAVEKLEKGDVTGVVTTLETCLQDPDKGTTLAYQEFMTKPKGEVSEQAREEKKRRVSPTRPLQASYAEPKFEVTLGRATTLQSPEREVVILQKVRRRALTPKDAEKEGIIDKAAMDILKDVDSLKDSKGRRVGLDEAIKLKLVDGTKGGVLEPRQGDRVSITEAVSQGLLDTNTGRVLVPIGRCLSLPELVSQGVVNPDTQRIVHPETGSCLTLQEAILCDIVNPLSRVPGLTKKSTLTLEEAVASGVIDEESGMLKTPSGSMTLVDAVQKHKVFEQPKGSRSDKLIPMLALTFPVALQHGFIDTKAKTFTHPVTKKKIPIQQAIKDGLLLPIPSNPDPDSVHVCEALDCNLVDERRQTLKHPRTGEEIPVMDAMDSGLLQLSPFDKSRVVPQTRVDTQFQDTTRTMVTSHYTTLTRQTTVILKPGYVMLGPNQVKNVDTGEVISFERAKELGVAEVETSEGSERPTFSDAVRRGLVDFQRGVYTDVVRGMTMPISEAILEGLLEQDRVEPAQPGKYTIIQVFELYYDEVIFLFRVPNVDQPLTFEQLLERGYLDLNAVIYDMSEGVIMTTEEAIESGHIDTKTGKLRREGQEPVSIKDAIRAGLLVAIEAPLLATLKGTERLRRIPPARSPVDKPQEATKRRSPSPPKVTSPKKGSPREQSPTKETPTRETLPKATQEAPTKGAPAKTSPSKELPAETGKDFRPSSPTKTPRGESPRKEDKPIPGKKAPDETPRTPKDVQSPVKTSPSKEPSPDAGEYFRPGSPGKTPRGISPSKEDQLAPGKKAPDETPGTSEGRQPPVKTSPSKEFPVDTGKDVGPGSPGKIPRSESPKKEDKPVPGKKAPGETPRASEDGQPAKAKAPVERSPSREVKEPGPPTRPPRTTPSPGKDTREKSPTKEAPTKAPTKEVPSRVPKSPTKEAPVKPTEKVLTKEVPTRPTDKAPTKDVPLKSSKETPTRGSPSKSPTKDVPSRGAPTSTPTRPGRASTSPGKETTPSTSRQTVQTAVKTNVFESPEQQQVAPFSSVSEHEVKLTTTGEWVPTKEMSSFSSTEVVVKQTFTEFRRDYEAEIVVGDQLSVRNLLRGDVLAPKNFTVFIPSSGRTMRLEDALETRQVTEDSIIMVRSMNELVLMDIGRIVPDFTLDYAVREGFYNPDKKSFTNPKTGKPISFSDFVAQKFVDLSDVKVKDYKAKEMVDLKTALSRNIVDRETGQMTHPETRQRISFFDAFVLCWIVRESVVHSRSESLTLSQAIRGLGYDEEKVTFNHPTLRVALSLHEALSCGLVDPSSVLVYCSESDELVPLTEAREELANIPDDSYLHPFTGHPVSLEEAFRSGYLVPDRASLSLPVAVERGMYDKDLRVFVHPDSNEHLNVLQALQHGLVDGFSTLVVDPETNAHIPLSRAVELGVMSVGDCGAASLPLELAICRGLVAEKRKCPTKQITDPRTGELVSLWDAIDEGLIEAERLMVKDWEGSRVVPYLEAVRLGLVDDADGSYRGPPRLTADEALLRGLVVDSATPMPLQNALELGLYSPASGTLRHPVSERELTVKDAIKEGMIEPDVLTIKVPHSGEMLSLSEAMSTGLLNPILGTVFDSEERVDVDLYEAAGRGIVLPVAKLLPLSEIVLKKFYDPVSGLVSSPFSDHPQSLRDAMRSGFVSTSSTVVCCEEGPITFREGINRELVDARAGILRVGGEPMDLRSAFERGYLIDVPPPLSLRTAMSLQLIVREDGRVLDPETGDTLNFVEAIDRGLIDGTSTKVMVSPGEDSKAIHLSSAMDCGKIDKHTSSYVTNDGTLIPLQTCFEEGLVIDVQPGLSLQELVRNGQYLDASNRLCLYGLDHTVTLSEAIVKRLLDPFLPFCSPSENRFVTLAEASKSGLIELQSGLVKDTRQLVKVPLSEALETGVVIDLDKRFSLQEAVTLGFCNPTTGRILHPVRGYYMNLKEALECEVLTADDTYVKDLHRGNFLSLDDAIEIGLINPVHNSYISPDVDFSLHEAVSDKLIICGSVPFSLVDLFSNLLFDKETCQFVDPRSSQHLSIARPRIGRADNTCGVDGNVGIRLWPP